jgi:hypothetical protein
LVGRAKSTFVWYLSKWFTSNIEERIIYFMGHVPIPANNCVALEAAYMVEAITLVRSMWSMRKAEIAVLVQDKYKSFICALPLSCFADASVKVKIEEKDFRAKSNRPDEFSTKGNEVAKMSGQLLQESGELEPLCIKLQVARVTPG